MRRLFTEFTALSERNNSNPSYLVGAQRDKLSQAALLPGRDGCPHLTEREGAGAGCTHSNSSSGTRTARMLNASKEAIARSRMKSEAAEVEEVLHNPDEMEEFTFSSRKRVWGSW